MLIYFLNSLIVFTELRSRSQIYVCIKSVEVTTLILNAPNKASLRTSIPMFIVKQWGLKAGDKLDWSLEARRMKSLWLLEWQKVRITRSENEISQTVAISNNTVRLKLQLFTIGYVSENQDLEEKKLLGSGGYALAKLTV